MDVCMYITGALICNYNIIYAVCLVLNYQTFKTSQQLGTAAPRLPALATYSVLLEPPQIILAMPLVVFFKANINCKLQTLVGMYYSMYTPFSLVTIYRKLPLTPVYGEETSLLLIVLDQ